jgi:phosphoglycerate dehydrogenase-like enzyme
MLHPVGEELLGEWVDLRTAATADDRGIVAEGVETVALIGRGPAKISAGVLDALPDLVLISAIGSGADWVDLEAARQRGIPVLHNPGVAPTPVTEYVIAAMATVYKRLREADAFLRSGGAWQPRDRFRGRQVTGKTLGLVGLGAIGSDVARRARAAFDMTVVGYDPLADQERFVAAGVERRERLADVLAEADIISIHVPLLPETRHLIGAAELALCKPDAVLVNASRGGVVDESALAAALQSGRLAGAAIDVYDPEPPARENPLFALPNVLVTPHIAGVTIDSVAKLCSATATDVIAGLRGIRPPHLVNPEAWPPARLGTRPWPLSATQAVAGAPQGDR